MGLDMGTGMAISAGGNLLGGMMGKNSAEDAARIQAKAANNAANLQALGFQYTANQLAPYNAAGLQLLMGPYYGGASMLPTLTSQYLQPITNNLWNIPVPGQYTNASTTPTVTPNITGPYMWTNPTTTAQTMWGTGADAQKQLEQTPGYQFTLGQGLNATQNAAAAQGRGVSGNALAGAAQYATGLANNTFNQQFQNAMQQQQQAYNQGLSSNNQLLNSLNLGFQQQLGAGNYNLQAQQQGFGQALAGSQLMAALNNQLYGQQRSNFYDPLTAMLQGLSLSENAGAMTGNNAMTAANNAGNYLTSGANATASGIIGGTNALSGGLGGASNSLMNYLLLNQLMGGSGGSDPYGNGYALVSGNYDY